MSKESQESSGSPYALSQTSSLFLNREKGQGIKRKQMELSPPHNKFTSLYDGNRTFSHTDSSVRITNLQKSATNNREKKSMLNAEIERLKTERPTQELELQKLQDTCNSVKDQLKFLKDQIEGLDHHKELSLKALQSKYNLKIQQMKLTHDQRLLDLKEGISSAIENIIRQGVLKDQSEKSKLLLEQQDLQAQIKQQEQYYNRKLIKLKEEHNKRLIQLTTSMDETIDNLKQEIALFSDKQEIHHAQVEKHTQELLHLEKTYQKYTSILQQLNAKNKDKESEIQLLRNNINHKKQQILDLNDHQKYNNEQVIDLTSKSLAFEKTLSQQEDTRRHLHGILQELKGNIRVYCRIRPQNKEEKADPLATIEVPDDELNENANQELIISKDLDTMYHKNNSTYKFQFDKVFLSKLDNSEIFEELSQLIQSSLDGYNVCVFAYGQTGSGKTFTMSHPRDGMITTSINKIFCDIEELSVHGWEYSIKGQFIEIYNESIVDLFVSHNSKIKHEIKHDDIEGKTSITNIATVDLTSKLQAEAILEKANKNRTTASTLANERSSRSHSIFMLKLYGKNSKTGAIREGTLNLIDLAGSERLAVSGAKGDRLKETQAINRSLSCLGDVIYALGQPNSVSSHIPYRNSKLTYLLKHSLGGNSKTLMFVNISPLEKNFNETVNSLRFATKVNSTKLQSKRPDK